MTDSKMTLRQALQSIRYSMKKQALYDLDAIEVLDAYLTQDEQHGEWGIDHSAGRPILTYGKCSVIEDEVAYGVIHSLRELEMLRAKMAEQHQGEPVALPERKDPTQQWHVVGGVAKAEGWNACLDEIAKLGPLYTRPDHNSLQRSWQAGYDTAWYAKNPAEKRTSVNADTGEVERLREQVETLRLMTNDYLVETERLRAELKTQNLRADAAVGDANEAERKLAERDALQPKLVDLLTRLLDNPHTFRRHICNNEEICELINALSASAEPSAPVESDFSKQKHDAWRRAFYGEESVPVERDERAAYDAWRHSESGYVRPFDRHEWSAWQARAALERKP